MTAKEAKARLITKLNSALRYDDNTAWGELDQAWKDFENELCKEQRDECASKDCMERIELWDGYEIFIYRKELIENAKQPEV